MLNHGRVQVQQPPSALGRLCGVVNEPESRHRTLGRGDQTPRGLNVSSAKWPGGVQVRHLFDVAPCYDDDDDESPVYRQRSFSAADLTGCCKCCAEATVR